MLVFVLAGPAGCAPGGIQSALDPASPDARLLTILSWTMFGTAALIFLAVLVVLALAILPGRGGARGPLPPRWAWALVIVGGIASPAVAGLAVTVSGLHVGQTTERGPAAADLRVEVSGREWWWEIRYVDPAGETIATTANELHLPVGRRTELMLRSDNVIHSFWVPALQGKTDLVPGKVNRLWVEPSRPGLFRGQCAEFCGLQHALMAFLVVVEPEAAFQAWLEREAGPAAVTEAPVPARGRAVFRDQGCGGCHTVRGTAAAGTLGPDLTHLAARRTLAAGTLPNTRGHLGGWITDPQSAKPGAKMPPTAVPPEDLQPLLVFLESLE